MKGKNVIMEKIIAPISYQGGKQRIAAQIVDIINPSSDEPFFDLCCGSGAVSLELINRGFPANKITMLDASIWGLFWSMVGAGTFDVDLFARYCNAIPKDTPLIQSYLKNLSSQPVREDKVYVFLLLQAGAFGGKAIWEHSGKWITPGFRNFWLPTATSNRRSPVNPMMPMPDTLLDRVTKVCEKMVGINGVQKDISTIIPELNGVIYIDPPYRKTTAYGYSFDIESLIPDIKTPCYVSEGKPLSSNSILVSTGRKKGGISGEREIPPNAEYLSMFNVSQSGNRASHQSAASSDAYFLIALKGDGGSISRNG